jgi:hypothetical protein
MQHSAVHSVHYRITQQRPWRKLLPSRSCLSLWILYLAVKQKTASETSGDNGGHPTRKCLYKILKIFSWLEDHLFRDIYCWVVHRLKHILLPLYKQFNNKVLSRNMTVEGLTINLISPVSIWCNSWMFGGDCMYHLLLQSAIPFLFMDFVILTVRLFSETALNSWSL